jgi:hypothetical protein
MTNDAYSQTQIANAKLIFSFWSNYVSEQQAIGFVANADRETSLDPKAVGDADMAYGIGQWHWSPRGQAILAGCGIDIRTASLENQLIAMHWELTHVETKAWKQILACKTIADAAQTICQAYERAGASDAQVSSAVKAWHWASVFGVTDLDVTD